MLAIVVTFKIHPGKESQILAALEKNAAGSRRESGCLKWEWSRHTDEPLKFAIYELYIDADAIESHKASPHFAQWLENIDDVIAQKTGEIYEVNGVDPRPVA